MSIKFRAQHLNIVDAFSPQLPEGIPNENVLYDPLAKGGVKVVRFNLHWRPYEPKLV
ncbi:hypothetical protein EV132_12612 [Rhizobium sullae]|uniref:Uncharacterized protein n=1 Tax=Rhizobium sullae TaxID=50338 RepID=A0A4R3PS71_RHISU|nr:hypothetical protein EV132_12612 [Rhizobium sullae]